MATEIRVPTLGESVTEATVGQWFKKVGDTVAVDEPLVELETDKVTLEVPAPSAGVIEAIAVKDGETVGVGLSLLILFAYYVLWHGASILGENAVLPPVVAAWAANVVCLVTGIALTIRASR